jgi:hypothetical protein
MNIQRAVNEFVSESQGLYQLLRAEGESISDVDLMTLREQLHILDTEAGHLQDLKPSRSDGGDFHFNGKRPHAGKQSGRNHQH